MIAGSSMKDLSQTFDAMKKEELKEKLVVGAKIRIGRKYSEEHGFKEGDVIELIEGSLDKKTGLYSYTVRAPYICYGIRKDFDSISHLFGNDLEYFLDCKIL